MMVLSDTEIAGKINGQTGNKRYSKMEKPNGTLHLISLRFRIKQQPGLTAN